MGSPGMHAPVRRVRGTARRGEVHLLPEARRPRRCPGRGSKHEHCRVARCRDPGNEGGSERGEEGRRLLDHVAEGAVSHEREAARRAEPRERAPRERDLAAVLRRQPCRPLVPEHAGGARLARGLLDEAMHLRTLVRLGDGRLLGLGVGADQEVALLGDRIDKDATGRLLRHASLLGQREEIRVGCVLACCRSCLRASLRGRQSIILICLCRGGHPRSCSVGRC